MGYLKEDGYLLNDSANADQVAVLAGIQYRRVIRHWGDYLRLLTTNG